MGWSGIITYLNHHVRLEHCLCWLVSSCNACGDQVSSSSAWVDRYHHELYVLICIAGVVWFLSAMHGLNDFIMHCMQWKLSSCTTCDIMVSWCNACDDQVSLCNVCKASDDWYHHSLRGMTDVIMQLWQVSSCNECEVEYGCYYALHLMKWYHHTIHLMNGIIMQ